MPRMVEIPSPSEGRPIPPKFEVRPLTTLSRADLQEATTMLAACRTETLRLNAEGDFAVVGFRLALDRTLIPV
jgi:hypothetical protein